MRPSADWSSKGQNFSLYFEQNFWLFGRTAERDIVDFCISSPAPLELKPPGHGLMTDSQEIDLNLTFDINTPEQVERKPVQVPSKKMRLDTSV